VRPVGRIVLGLVALAAAGALAGTHSWATAHVREMTRDADASTYQCLRCHGPAREVTYRPGQARPEPHELVASADGRRLFATSAPTRSLMVVDTVAGRLERTVALDGEPRGVALSRDGALLAVSLMGTDRVALLDAHSLDVLGHVAVGVDPAGLAFDATGARLFVANSASRDVSVVDVAARREEHRVAGGREPWVVTASPDGGTVAVVSRMAEADRPERLPRTEVTLFDGATAAVVRRVSVPSSHLAEGAAFTPDGRHLLVPLIRVRNLLPILQVGRGWVMSAALAVVGVEDGHVDLLPLCDAGEGFSDPAGIAVDAGLGRVYVSGGGSDLVAVLDLAQVLARVGTAPVEAPERFSDTRGYVLRRFATASNPRGLVLLGSAPGAQLAVAERLADTVSLFDPSATSPAAPPLRTVRLASDWTEDAVRRGDRVFHDAGYAFQGWFSCRSCHPSMHTDGLTWDFEIDGIGGDVVLNRSLRGVAGTEPFKWIGLNPTLQRQCGPRFAMVLTRADPVPEPLADDLAAFLNSLPPPRPVPDAGRDMAAVERGRVLFERSTRRDGSPIQPSGRCVTCHPPPLYTNRLKADVGTQGPRDRTGLFDVPHLTGIASKQPYLHDGRAVTLEEIWTALGVEDQHGVMTDLDKNDLNDLVEFLRGL
jgi:YVTN family beta-propeller protein